MVGPVLLKQDPIEAKANVDKRLEFNATEMYALSIPDSISIELH